MGNAQQTRITKPLEKFDVELVCDKIFHHLTLQRNRKINELATKERELADKLRKKSRSYSDTVIDIGVLVNLLKYITAAKIVSRYSQLIKNHSMIIAECCRTNNYSPIRELSQYFEGIVWSTDKLNLSYIAEFNALIQRHFRPSDIQEIMKFNKVDKELLNCFASIEPTPVEIQEYLVQFLGRHQITNFQWPGGMAPMMPGQQYQQGGAYLPPPPGAPAFPGQPGFPGGYQMPPPGPGGFGGPGMPQYPGHNQFPPQAPTPGPMGGPGPVPAQPNPYDEAAIDDLIKNLNLGGPGGAPDLQPPPAPPGGNTGGFGVSPVGGLGISVRPDAGVPQNPIPPTTFDPNTFPGPNVGVSHNAFPPQPPQSAKPPVAVPPTVSAHPGNDLTPPPAPINAAPPTNAFPPQPPAYAQQFQGPPVKVRQYATGPEAYTDDTDDNCEMAQFEPLILALRIEEMRKNKV